MIDKLKELHFTIQGLVSVSAGVAQSGQSSAGRVHSWEKLQPMARGSGTSTGCAGQWWSHHPWKCSKDVHFVLGDMI